MTLSSKGIKKSDRSLNKVDSYEGNQKIVNKDVPVMSSAMPKQLQVNNQSPRKSNHTIREEVEISVEEVVDTEDMSPEVKMFNNKSSLAPVGQPKYMNMFDSNKTNLNQQNGKTQRNTIMEFKLLEHINKNKPPRKSSIPIFPQPSDVRRQSRGAQIIQLMQAEQQKKNRKYSKDFIADSSPGKPPISRKDNSLNNAIQDTLKPRAHSDSEKSKSMTKNNSQHSQSKQNIASANQSHIKQSSINSSMNQSEYKKNFIEIIESIEKHIIDRRRLKIVPYSKKQRKVLLSKIEKDLAILTKMMKNRKDNYESAIDDDLFRKASKFHTEPVNEKIKARFLAYLIKEYGVSKEIPPTAIVPDKKRSSSKTRKDNRKRSTSKPLSPRKTSPENYMINIVESHPVENRRGSNLKSTITEGDTSSSMPQMQKGPPLRKKVSNFDKDSKDKQKPDKTNEEAFFYQSSSNLPTPKSIDEIEHHLNMKPEEKRIAQGHKKRINTGRKNIPKRKKQNVIDEDSSLNLSTVMTQGWGVTRDKPYFGDGPHGDSVNFESNVSSTNSKKIRRVTDRLYNGNFGNHHHKHEHYQTNLVAQEVVKHKHKPPTREWIGNRSNRSIGSQVSSEDGVWVSNF